MTPRKPRTSTPLRVAAASMLAIVLSTVGQNSVLGVFMEQQAQALGIEALQFCVLLALGTLIAAVAMRLLRGCVARWSTSRLALVTAVASAGALASWGGIVVLESRLSPWSIALLLTLCFTGIRLFVRGIFKIVGASVVNEGSPAEQRSKTMALSNVGAGLVFAVLPLIAYHLLQAIGFLGTMLLFAVASLVAGALVFRVASESAATGSERAVATEVSDSRQRRSLGLDEAKRTRRFWIYTMGLPLNTLIQSSASLMLLPIARYAEVEPSRAYAIYLPAMIIGLPCVFIATRRMRNHPAIFVGHQLALVVSTLGFLFLGSGIGFWAAGLGFGVAAALYTAMAGNLWPTAYGTRHAKQFYAYATAIDLGASALGPILFGLVHYLWGVQVALMLVLPLPLFNVGAIGLSALRAKRRAPSADAVMTRLARVNVAG